LRGDNIILNEKIELAAGERAVSYSCARRIRRERSDRARCPSNASTNSCGGEEGDSRVALINYVRDESTWYRVMVNAAAVCARSR